MRVAISAPSGEVSIYQNAVPYLDAHLRAAGLPPDPTGARLAGETALTLFPTSLELPVTGAPGFEMMRSAYRTILDALVDLRIAAQRIAAEIAALPSIDEAAVTIERMARS